jgi:glycosyltransferase involved in cell wall biosynthesis
VYPSADRIIAVSDGVAEDLAKTARLPRERITTVYNPAVSPSLELKAKDVLDHPWFQPGEPPVILAVGRFTSVKGFDALIRAFAGLKGRSHARLMILGEGRERTALERLVRDCGLAQDVAMPGFVRNPYRYMARAKAFVVSSRYEGLSMVLIEALACGCPVVSTDCPSGPREVLEGGKYGPLVPVGDVSALTNAMARVLARPPPAERLRRRAQDFYVDRVVERYEKICFGPDVSC